MPRRVSQGQIPLNFAVTCWNNLPNAIAELERPQILYFKKEIREFGTFENLEQMQIRRQTTVPPLQRYYANL